jgi:hypothetical protein
MPRRVPVVVLAAIGASITGFMGLWLMLMFWTSPSKCSGSDSLVDCYSGPVAMVGAVSALAGAVGTGAVVALRRHRLQSRPPSEVAATRHTADDILFDGMASRVGSHALRDALAGWNHRSPTDPVAYAYGALKLVVFRAVHGPIVGAIIGTILATASCVIGLRILRSIWLAIRRRLPER